MKRFVSIIMIVAMMFYISACGTKQYEIGETLMFGSYEQDGDEENGPEPIEWIVLDKDDEGNILVISRYCLDCQPYNNRDSEVTWEDSSIRSWLNYRFYNDAFSSEEQSRIIESDIENEENEDFDFATEGGRDTSDRIFFLSIDEAELYFEDDSQNDWGWSASRGAMPTQYAITQGALVEEHYGEGMEDYHNKGYWWLRTPGMSNYEAAVVTETGSIANGYEVDSNEIAIRPSMWISP